ncbi:MAG: VanZ family protein [Bacteroidales bacterium]|nr:VanZ family protein [Bacteroidales bacterium]
MQYFIKYPLTWLLITGITVLCLIPVPETPAADVPGFDKLVHTGMYAVLCAVILWERVRQSATKPIRMSHCFVGAFVLPVAMSGAIELLQAYATTCRSGDWWDMAANTLGVLLAWLFFVFFYKNKVKNKKIAQ